MGHDSAHNQTAAAMYQQRQQLKENATYLGAHGTPDPNNPLSTSLGGSSSSVSPNPTVQALRQQNQNAWAVESHGGPSPVESQYEAHQALKPQSGSKIAGEMPQNAINSQADALAAAGPAAQKAGQQIGQALPQGMASGIQQNSGQANQAGNNLGQGVQDSLKKNLDISSPSGVAATIGAQTVQGLQGGIGDAMSGSSSAIQGIASNSGLQVGYVYGESVTSGALSVIQSANFATAAVSGIGSALAQTALGAAGMLGPAGPGGEIYKTPAVTIPPDATSTVTPTVNLTITAMFDGTTPMTAVAQQVFEASMTALTNQLTAQAS